MSDLGLIDRFCVLTWSAAMQISCKKKNFFTYKRVKSPQDFISVHQHGCRCIFYTPIWPP